MEEGNVSSSLTSAAAFVEGGIQEACDDACSICLEAFCDSDPSTLTTCKHEFHLQCILEWCQRSSQCPMCWQSIGLKDPSSQELLDAVEHERNMRMNPPRNTTIFHHPSLGDFELQHLPVNASEAELEERIVQHLAAAAAMGRARQLARREGQRIRSSQGRPRFLVFSANPNEASAPSPLSQREGSSPPPEVITTGSNSPYMTVGGDAAHLVARSSTAQAEQLGTTASGSSPGAYQHGTSSSNRSPAHTSPNSQDRTGGPSDFQTFSDSLKSRLSAFSTRYKESITKSTRGWKERLFARNTSTPEPNSEVREADQRNANGPGIAALSRVMDHLQIAEHGRTNTSTASRAAEDTRSPDSSEQQVSVMGSSLSLNEDASQATTAASPAST
ncbi:E3 ubiquitin-protein ligase RHF2A-like [Salvia hispanica]|uniref:E3 ubiquitin-protein ligase RHF2A-like n=1 Tax=Salvia hispanica TaxID=49212 RepID=UPI00200990E1|nr:E3 ubiquitin-protein ligase RHF2A-like [Salvia hispanica]